MPKVKIAQIGCGRWGKNLLRNFYNLPQCQVVLLCDNDNAHLKSAQENYPKINKFTTEIKDVAQSDAEAVIIATPASTHYNFASQMLSVGKHVFIEKPIVLKEEELQELKKTAELKNLIIMEGHLLLYHPAILALKKAIAANKIGQIHHIYFKRSNLGAIRFKENALWDFAPHDFSVLFFLYDSQPEFISSLGQAHFQKNIAETVFTAIRFKDGMITHLHESWLDPDKDRKIFVVGTEGMLVLDELANDGRVKLIKKKAVFHPDKKYEHERFDYIDDGVEVLPVDETEPLRNECEHFLEAILKQTLPRSNADNSLRVLQTLLKAQKSIENNGKRIFW